MKFLIADTYYPAFLQSFWRDHKELASAPYRRQHHALIEQHFGTSDYYSMNLKKLGHEAVEFIFNDPVSQRQWAKERGFPVSSAGLYADLQSLPLLHRLIGRPRWVQEIALAQIKDAKPDVLYFQDLSILNPDTLKKAKRFCRLLVGQIASPMPARDNVLAFDLILTSFPHFVPRFQAMGIASEYFKIAFEPSILKRIGRPKRVYDISFVGSFTPHHSVGTKLLEAVAQFVPIHVWGRGGQYLSPASPLRRHFHGQAWGLDTYRILARSNIVINRHISVAEEYANNMRLYESTGMGAMLLTDEKKNLNDLFTVGKEVVTYHNERDLIKKVRYYLAHGVERRRIAHAGQKRTLGDHSYAKRMKELVKIVNKYL